MGKSRPLGTTTHTCLMCGKQWSRSEHRGQQPKWCSQRCADLGKAGATRVCQRCGVTYFGVGKKYCSRACSGAGANERHGGNEIANAYVADDWDTVAALIQDAAEVTSSGCWEWRLRIDRWGYPVIRHGKRNLGAHRVMLEAQLRQRLGLQAAHHVCANKACVNPSHLQAVTARENTAEMLARRAYINRIRELEAALAEIAPNHHLLSVVPMA